MLRTISLYLILFLCCSLRIEAQNIKVESFTRLENDITARVNVVRDANDDECALIKMVTTDVGYNLDEGLKREPRVGEIWFYVPQGTKRIVIRHQKLGKLVYALPETLKAKTTYQIKLPSNVEIIVHEDAGGQYVVMSVQPSDASVYVDDILEVTNSGNFSRMLKYGEHTYRIEHPLYETKSGTFTIKNKKELIEIKLVPAYGYLSFTSTPTNAEITVNGKILGRTPFKSEALREGTYRIKTSLSSYVEDERTVTVVRGQTNEMAIPLAATFGYMEVNTVPEQGADVYVNGMKVGTTPYRSDKLSEGICRVKVVQSMYSPQEREVHIVRGQTEKISFNLTATFGEVVVCSEDPQAEIVINGENKGVGSWKGRLLEGLYQLVAHKKNYRDGTKSVEIKSGMNQQITIPAPTPVYGSLNINSSLVNAVIKIDGREVGRTPDVIKNVLVGEREVEISKEGCASFKQRVLVEEGEIKDLDVTLPQGKSIRFYNYTGKYLSVDGIEKKNSERLFKSELPYKTDTYTVQETLILYLVTFELSYQQHTLSIIQGANKLMKDFVVTENSPVAYNVKYKAYTANEVPGMQLDTKELVLDGKQYHCEKSMNASDDSGGFVQGSKAYIGIADPKNTGDGWVTKIKTFDFNTGKWGELPPFPANCRQAKYSFVQGYPIIKCYNDIYICKENVWQEVSIPVPADPKNKPEANTYVINYRGENFLFYVIDAHGYYRIYWKDVYTNVNRKLGEGVCGEFKPRHSTLSFSGKNGQLLYKCDRLENFYGTPWTERTSNHVEECLMRLDFLPLKKSKVVKGLVLEPLPSQEPVEKTEVGINGITKSAVDWSKFLDKY